LGLGSKTLVLIPEVRQNKEVRAKVTDAAAKRLTQNVLRKLKPQNVLKENSQSAEPT
jgi:hypothetical protein